jgi:hypothetical protein
MLRSFRRLYSAMHIRDVNAFFDGNHVTYSIPIIYEAERKILGNTLNLKINLQKPEGPYTIEHYGHSALLGIYPDFTRQTYKTELVSTANLNLNEGCCAKK